MMMAFKETEFNQLLEKLGQKIISDNLDDLGVRVVCIEGVTNRHVSIQNVGDSISVEEYYSPGMALPHIEDLERFLTE